MNLDLILFYPNADRGKANRREIVANLKWFQANWSWFINLKGIVLI